MLANKVLPAFRHIGPLLGIQIKQLNYGCGKVFRRIGNAAASLALPNGPSLIWVVIAENGCTESNIFKCFCGRPHVQKRPTWDGREPDFCSQHISPPLTYRQPAHPENSISH